MGPIPLLLLYNPSDTVRSTVAAVNLEVIIELMCHCTFTGPRGEDPEEAAAKAQAAAGQAADLSVLVAINALKKLCCHPDLIWDMLARKAKDPDKAHITTGVLSCTACCSWLPGSCCVAPVIHGTVWARVVC